MSTDHTPRIIRATQAGIIALSLGSFAISFANIRTAAESVGTVWYLAIVYGLLAEGFIALATYTAWVARGQRLAIYPWFLALSGFAFSLWANARNSLTIGEAVIHAVPVIALPAGVHLLIVLMEAHRRRVAMLAAAEPVEVPAPAVEYVTVQAEVTPDIDPATVINPRAVAYKLLAHTHETPSQRSYAEKRFREALAA